MKKILKGLTALMICGALNFGLTVDAQAAESDALVEFGGAESQELSRHRYEPPPPPPPPHYGSPMRHDRWGHRPPPPPHRGGYWHEPPPPPGHRPPPPPSHRW